MRTLSLREKRFLLVFIVLFLIVVLFKFISGCYHNASIIAEKVKNKKELYCELLEKQISIEDIINRQEQLQLQINKAEKFFSLKAEDAAAIFSRAEADLEQLSIVAINPGTEIKEQYYYTYPFNIQLQGRYPSIISFIERLEAMHGTAITQLDLSSECAGEILVGELTVEIYSQAATKETTYQRTDLMLGRTDPFVLPGRFHGFEMEDNEYVEINQKEILEETKLEPYSFQILDH